MLKDLILYFLEFYRCQDVPLSYRQLVMGNLDVFLDRVINVSCYPESLYGRIVLYPRLKFFPIIIEVYFPNQSQ